MCGGGMPCITSGFIGGGIKALRTRNSIILYHSGSTPAFSCSVVICRRCPSSFTHAMRQLTLPCSSTSKPSSGEMGRTPGIGGGKRGSGASIGKLGLNLKLLLDKESNQFEAISLRWVRWWIWDLLPAGPCFVGMHGRGCNELRMSMYIWVIVRLGSRRLLFRWVVVLGLYLFSLF